MQLLLRHQWGNGDSSVLTPIYRYDVADFMRERESDL